MGGRSQATEGGDDSVTAEDNLSKKSSVKAKRQDSTQARRELMGAWFSVLAAPWTGWAPPRGLFHWLWAFQMHSQG